jgi:hypothetical protein
MSKMQLLDPIGVGCKLILLQFSEPGTRLRISDHVLFLDPPNIGDSLIWRRWNGASRDDVRLLFASIVRFVELYLVINEHDKEIKDTKIKSNSVDSNDSTEEIPICTDLSENFTLHQKNYSANCSENLKKLAQYMTTGIPLLEDVYGLTCAGLTLQYYINLLNSGIDGTYSKKLLPKSSQDVINRNLIQPEKLKAIWKDEDIVRITEMFNNCFATRESTNKIMLEGYITNIITILRAKDDEFRQIVGGAF